MATAYCFRCGDDLPEGAEPDSYCASCVDARNEAAAARSLEAYYGASRPQTIDEQTGAAWRVTQEHR